MSPIPMGPQVAADSRENPRWCEHEQRIRSYDEGVCKCTPSLHESLGMYRVTHEAREGTE